jgi:hypothetical protein
MNHGTSCRQEEFSPAEISQVLACFRRSGLGVMQFAQQSGLPPGRLHYWIYQKGRTRSRRPLPASAAQPVFHEIKLPSRPECGGGWAAEVGLPGGLAIRFRASAPAEWVGAVVQALQRPC